MAWVIPFHLCHNGYFQENKWQEMLVRMCEKKTFKHYLLECKLVRKCVNLDGKSNKS